MTRDSYRFIHLSDIHFGQEKNGTLVTHNDARNKLIEDCAEFARENGPADGILVVGDIAYSGKPHEYDTAAEWLRAVARAGGCEHDRVRTIPGNHDIDRDRINVYCRNAHNEIRDATTAQLTGRLDEHLAVEEEGNALLPKVAAYREFASRFDCDFPSLKKPCWAKDYPLGSKYTLRILGMNSVQVCDGADAEGNMLLGNNQYVIDEEANVIPIALIHHPLTWFMDKSAAKPYLHRAPVLLFGHEHVQGLEKVENQYGQVQLHVFSGAVNPPEDSHEYPFRYNWIEFRLVGDLSSKELRLSLWPRVWSHSETKYAVDRQSLGEKPCHSFNVPCPQFTPEAISISCDVIEDTAQSSQQTAEVKMEDNQRNFERLKYFFWTYLEWQDRVKVLASLDLLPKTTTQPMPQTLEHLAFKAARQRGKLRELWERTMAFVPPEAQVDNPYTEEGYPC